MKTISQELTDYAINKIKNEYHNDIALLIAVEGNSVNGDGHSECFDYFIPATERGYELSRTFIINGIGHDLYPRSWERIEKMADLKDGFTNGLGKAKILYSRTEEDKARFISLQRKLFENLKNRSFIYNKALIKIDEAMDLYRTMMFENELYKVRMATGYISEYLSIAISYLNETYLIDWQTGNIAQLAKMQKVPNGFTGYLKSMLDVRTVDELKGLAYLMIGSVRSFAAENAPEKPNKQVEPNFHLLSDWFQELSLTWRRISYYCDAGNAEMTFNDACYLQNELMIVKEEFGLEEMDLLGYYNSLDLKPFKARSDELERYIVSQIESNGIKIARYDTLEDFLANN